MTYLLEGCELVHILVPDVYSEFILDIWSGQRLYMLEFVAVLHTGNAYNGKDPSTEQSHNTTH